MRVSAFLPPSFAVLRGARQDSFQLAGLRKGARSTGTSRPFLRLVMIQRPDQDGPPDISAFFNRSSSTPGSSGPPISVATGRARLDAHSGDSAAAVAAAFDKALSALKDDGALQLCHCTFSLDVNKADVAHVVREKLSSFNVPVIGRSVNKKDTAGTIEVLLLRSDAPGGIVYAEVPIETSSGTASSQTGSASTRVSARELREATVAAAKTATSDALNRLASPDSCTFLIFGHTPVYVEADEADVLVWSSEAAVREGVEAASPGAIAYGGPAVGSQEGGAGWSLLSGAATSLGSDNSLQRVCVAAVPGSINFLISSVVKNWAQPVYTEPLAFMLPRYVDDASRDLLTAIRYDDWDRFIWCLEDQGLDVNITWPDKQNQSPLLAACARARTRMVNYLIAKGADVQHRNAGNFTAAMYTRKLTDYDAHIVLEQLKALEAAGLNTKLSAEDEKAVRDSGDGRMFLRDAGSE